MSGGEIYIFYNTEGNIKKVSQGAEMRLLKKITDMEILNKEGISEAEPRFAARAVMVNDNTEIAVMYSPVFHLYSLPGG